MTVNLLYVIPALLVTHGLSAVFGAFWGRKHPGAVNAAAVIANEAKSKL